MQQLANVNVALILTAGSVINVVQDFGIFPIVNDAIATDMLIYAMQKLAPVLVVEILLRVILAIVVSMGITATPD